MSHIKVYCSNIVVVDGEIEYRLIDVLEEVLLVEMTPKLSASEAKKVKVKLPPGIPLFHTLFGKFLTLPNMENWERALAPYGFDLFMPNILVNTQRVSHIKENIYGNVAYFKDDTGLFVPISRTKTKDYKHLILL